MQSKTKVFRCIICNTKYPSRKEADQCAQRRNDRQWFADGDRVAFRNVRGRTKKFDCKDCYKMYAVNRVTILGRVGPFPADGEYMRNTGLRKRVSHPETKHAFVYFVRVKTVHHRCPITSDKITVRFALAHEIKKRRRR